MCVPELPSAHARRVNGLFISPRICLCHGEALAGEILLLGGAASAEWGASLALLLRRSASASFQYYQQVVGLAINVSLTLASQT